MTSSLLSMVFDSGLALLLIATIIYCAKLSQRIRILQDSRGELAQMIMRFDESTQRASHSLTELQTISKKVMSALEVKIERANFLADDLAFLIEKSTKLANILEKANSPQEKPTNIVSFQPSLDTPPPAFSYSTSPPLKESSSVITTPSIEEVLNRLAASAANAASRHVPPGNANAAPAPARTGAERELLAALKTTR